MDMDTLNAYRQTRLLALVKDKHGGNKTACGRALGYEDGAYVRQMLAGGRPITEKKIKEWVAERRVPAGWFDLPKTESATPPAPPTEQSTLGGIEWLPQDVQDLVNAYMDLLPEDRVALAAPIIELGAKAKRYREHAQEAIGNKGSFPEGKMGKGWSAADKPPPIPPKRSAAQKAAKKAPAKRPHGSKS